jgi:hypothetical protein
MSTTQVNPLLSEVLEAHGGAAAWSEVERLVARLSLGGPFWELRGWPGVYADQTVTVAARHEEIAFSPFTAPDRESYLVTEPERIGLRTTAGEVLEERADPRPSSPLPFDPLRTKWDALQVAYFTSCACWSYLTTPFLLALPDVVAVEAEPWHEAGETWRKLDVTFPASVATHNTAQSFYFGADDLLLRRLDYSPDVTGNPPMAHYVYDSREFGGFVFPTRRRVCTHDGAGVADQSRVVITIDIEEIEVVRG